MERYPSSTPVALGQSPSPPPGSSSADLMGAGDPFQLFIQERPSPVVFEPRMPPSELSDDVAMMGPDAEDLVREGSAQLVEEPDVGSFSKAA